MIDREKATNETEGCCTSCNFYLPFIGLCSNTLSDRRNTYVPPTDVCDEYTALEDDYEDESEQTDS